MEPLNQHQIKSACSQLGIAYCKGFAGIMTTIRAVAEEYKALADKRQGGGFIAPCVRGYMVIWRLGK